MQHYMDRLAGLHLHGQASAQKKPFSFAHLFGWVAWGAYEKQKYWATQKEVTMEQIIGDHLPGWNLVAQTQQDTLEAVDNIWLVQNTQSLDCVLAFEGTHTFAEFFGNLKSPSFGYCGLPDVHSGYADKLYWLMKYSMPKLRPSLAKCNKARGQTCPTILNLVVFISITFIANSLTSLIFSTITTIITYYDYYTWL